MSENDIINVENNVEAEFLKKFRIVDHYKTVTERYYTPELYKNPLSDDNSNQDTMVLRHSNR